MLLVIHWLPVCLIQNPLFPHPGLNLLRFSDSWSQWITVEWWLIWARWKKGCSSSLLSHVTPVYSIYVTKQMREGMRNNVIHRSSSKAHHANFYMFKFLGKTKNDQCIFTLLGSPNFIVHQVLNRDAVSHLLSLCAELLSAPICCPFHPPLTPTASHPDPCYTTVATL